jgi:hypothetical protein
VRVCDPMVITAVAMAAAPTVAVPTPICAVASSITPESTLIFVAATGSTSPSVAASLTLHRAGTECADHPRAVATAATDGPLVMTGVSDALTGTQQCINASHTNVRLIVQFFSLQQFFKYYMFIRKLFPSLFYFCYFVEFVMCSRC